MSKRNTETLFLRIDPEVARLVRRESETRQVGISQEAAFRHYVAQSTREEERQNFLGSVEEALVKRLEGRLREILNRVGDLYAREAFDHAEALFLVKALVSMMARDEKVTERLLVHARKDATERLQQRVGPGAEGMSQLRGYVEKLTAQLAQVQQEAQAQRKRAEIAEQQLTGAVQKADSSQKELHQLRRVHEYERARDAWALEQFESQGMLRRRSFQEWRTEYRRNNAAPAGVDA